MSGRLHGWWRTWVAIWNHHEHPRTLAIIRVCLGMTLAWDLAWMAPLGLVVPIVGPEAAGGWGRVLDRSEIPWVWQLLPATPGSAWLVWGIVLTCAVLVTVGLGTRVAAVVLVLFYAQMAQTLDAADRGIDMLIRNMILLLAFAGSHRTAALDAWWRTGSIWGDGKDVPAWPRHLIVVQLALMYWIAGIAKVGSSWTPMGEFSALYLILQDAAVARFDWSWLAPAYRLTQLATGITICWEYSAPVVLLLYWYRHTWDRPGRLRAWCNRHHVHLWWLSVGVVFHVSIAVLLNLGIFPFAMMALYPAFVHPDTWWWVRRPAAAPAVGDARPLAPVVP